MTLSHADDDKVVMPDLIGHLIINYTGEQQCSLVFFKSKQMKKLLTLAAIFCCFGCVFNSCETNTEDNGLNDNTTTNPVAGTSWEWVEDPITWTFTFSENEVTFDYKAVFSPTDISTDQYKSKYIYTSDGVEFNMEVWSKTVWKCIGTISGDTMKLTDKGVEAWEIVLKKK